MAVKPPARTGGLIRQGCLDTTPEPDENVTFSRTGEEWHFPFWPSLKIPGEVNPPLLLRIFSKDHVFPKFSGLLCTTN